MSATTIEPRSERVDEPAHKHRDAPGVLTFVLVASLFAFAPACSPDDDESAPSESTAERSDPNGFQLVVANSLKCLSRNHTSSGTPAVQNACSDEPRQMWKLVKSPDNYTTIVSALETGHDSCLDVARQSMSDNAKIVISDCAERESQQWSIIVPSGSDVSRNGNDVQISGPVSFQNRLTGKCLTVDHTSTSDNAFIVQYSCNSGANQSWHKGQTAE